MRQFSTLSVMLLEDEYLIALDAEEILTSLGLKHVQIVNTLAAAADIAESGDVDIAVLDLNINGQMSFAVAELFRKRRIPIIFASGYELRGRIDADLEGAAIHLRKPYTLDSVKGALGEALRKIVIPPASANETHHPVVSE